MKSLAHVDFAESTTQVDLAGRGRMLALGCFCSEICISDRKSVVCWPICKRLICIFLQSVAAELSSPPPAGPSMGVASRRGGSLSSVLSLPVSEFALFATTTASGPMAGPTAPSEGVVHDQSDSSLSSPDLKCTVLGYDVT